MFEITDKLDETCFPQPRPVVMLSVQDNLMPLSWHMPVSKEPFMYAVSVRDENHSHELLQKNKEFALNFLDSSHVESFIEMGKEHGDTYNKFEASGFSRKQANKISSTLIEESYMIYECTVKDVLNYGDHDVFIAKVECIHNKQDVDYLPTLFMGKRRYKTIKDIEV